MGAQELSLVNQLDADLALAMSLSQEGERSQQRNEGRVASTRARDDTRGRATTETRDLTATYIRQLPRWECTDRSRLSAENESCVICFEDFVVGAKMLTLPCAHSFHAACVCEWLNKHTSCPSCQMDVRQNV